MSAMASSSCRVPPVLSSLALTPLLLGLLFAPPAAYAKDDFEDPGPMPGAVCPAVAEDYLICRDNPWSGNCGDFVHAAHELGRLYRFTVLREPDTADKLKATLWWGCGTAKFMDLRALLEKIGTPEAQSVLAEEPYRSLPAPGKKPASPAPDARLDCDGLKDDAAYVACEKKALAAADARHQDVVSQCAAKLPPMVRDQLEASEAAWRTTLGVECPEGDSGTPCRLDAIRERTDAIVSEHSDCADL
jgi:hypothetical protein